MTQEKIIRMVLQGFVADPPDTEHHQGFLAGIIYVAQDIMGFGWDDPDILKAEAASDKGLPDVQSTIKTIKKDHALKIIHGGKPETEGT